MIVVCVFLRFLCDECLSSHAPGWQALVARHPGVQLLASEAPPHPGQHTVKNRVSSMAPKINQNKIPKMQKKLHFPHYPKLASRRSTPPSSRLICGSLRFRRRLQTCPNEFADLVKPTLDFTRPPLRCRCPCAQQCGLQPTRDECVLRR